MEKDLSSTPTSVNVQGSSPVLDIPSCPSQMQIPLSPISSNLSASPTQHEKSLTSLKPRKLPSSSPTSTHTTAKQMDPPLSLDKSKPLSPAVSPSSTCKTVSTNPSLSALIRTPLPASLALADPQTSTISPTSNLTSASSTATSTSSSMASAKRTFASMAKRVIIQERLRKAEEEDAIDEEDGKNSFIQTEGLNDRF